MGILSLGMYTYIINYYDDLAPFVTVFWKASANAEIHICLYMKVTLMYYPETPSIWL